MNKEQYADLMMDTVDAICYICKKDTYELQYMNRAMRKLLGLSEEESIIGKKCYELLQGNTQPCHFCNMDQLAVGEKLYWQHENKKIGYTLHLESTLMQIEQDIYRVERGQNCWKQREKICHLQTKLTTEETLIRCIESLVQEPEDIALERVLEIVGKFYAASHTYIFALEEEENSTLQMICQWGYCDMIRKPPAEIPMEILEGWLYEQYQTQQKTIAFYKEVSQMEPLFQKLWKQYEAKAVMIVPLQHERNIIGFLGIDNPSSNCSDLQFLNAVGHFVRNDLEKRILIKQLEYASYVDMLTGVKNRNKYLKVMQWYEKIKPRHIGVMFADINGMKEINDTQGHSYGDFIIKHNAGILKKCVEKQIYRIGGDEFVVICENMPEDVFFDKVSQIRAYADVDDEYRMAIGAVWQDVAEDVKSMILQADEKMYDDKKRYYANKKKSMRSSMHDIWGTES